VSPTPSPTPSSSPPRAGGEREIAARRERRKAGGIARILGPRIQEAIK